MKKKNIISSIAMVAIVTILACATTACTTPSKTNKEANKGNEVDKNANKDSELIEDTIVALLPPVTLGYEEKLDEWIAEYEAANPNITIKLTKASWEDAEEKLNVMVNAGSPPDIAFSKYDVISKYVDLGMCVDIQDYVGDNQLNDFNQAALNYFKVGDSIYGLPAYVDVHSIGGNREMLEAAGIDWKHVQQNGWSYDEFREAIKKGVIKDGNDTKTYGFVFACSGVTAVDYFNIFVKSGGFPAEFDENLKYAYTSPKMLSFLHGIRTLIDDGSMPDYLSSVDAGKRWNMFLTGQTMITGKGLTSFERSAAKNNALLETGGEAVEGSIMVDYIVLPTPYFEDGGQFIRTNVDGYICLTGEKNPDPQHLKNVADFMYFLSSGERAAYVSQNTYLTPISETGMEAYKKLPAIENKNEDNTAAVQYLIKNMCPARPDIPIELSAKATKLNDEVLIPKFQAMLAGEATPEQVYQVIQDAAFSAFGQDGCLTD